MNTQRPLKKKRGGIGKEKSFGREGGGRSGGEDGGGGRLKVGF